MVLRSGCTFDGLPRFRFTGSCVADVTAVDVVVVDVAVDVADDVAVDVVIDDVVVV